MSGIRVATAAVLLAAVLGAPLASAAPTCPLVTDAAGDQRSPEGDVQELSSESLDLLAANLTTTADALVATIRVTDLDLARVTNAGGLGFHVYLDTGKTTYDMLVRHYVDGDVGDLMVVGARLGEGSTGAAGGTRIGAVEVWFDEDQSKVVITGQLRDFGRGLRRGTPVLRTLVGADFAYGTSGQAGSELTGRRGTYGGNSNSVDTAYTARRYVVGDRGCAFAP